MKIQRPHPSFFPRVVLAAAGIARPARARIPARIRSNRRSSREEEIHTGLATWR